MLISGWAIASHMAIYIYIHIYIYIGNNRATHVCLVDKLAGKSCEALVRENRWIDERKNRSMDRSIDRSSTTLEKNLQWKIVLCGDWFSIMTHNTVPVSWIRRQQKPNKGLWPGFILLGGKSIFCNPLWKRNLLWKRHRVWTCQADPSTQGNHNHWVPCKVFRCGEQHIFLGPSKSLAGSKALPIDIDSKLDADLLRSALGFYRTRRFSLLTSISTLFYLLRLSRMQANRSSLPRYSFWKSILAILYKTLLFQWSCSIQMVQHWIHELHLKPIKVFIPDEMSHNRENKTPAVYAQIDLQYDQRQCSLFVPRSFAIAVASAYRLPIYVSHILVERNSVYPRVDCRGRWYVANPTTRNITHLPRNAPIWKYRISELEKMETQQLYTIMMRSGISCHRSNTHQELINRLIPFMDRIQRRSVSIWRELWKRKMYKSLKVGIE